MLEAHKELIILGPSLCKEIRHAGAEANEALLALHRVLARMFHEDLSGLDPDSLRSLLRTRLRHSLQMAGA